MFSGSDTVIVSVVDAVRTLPSVTGAAVVQGVPMGAGGFFGSGVIEGHVPPPGAEAPIYRLRVVSPGCLDTMRIPVVAGREFEVRDEVGERGIVAACVAAGYLPARRAARIDPMTTLRAE